MKQSVYKSYDELPLFFNAELVGKVLGISSTSTYELMHRDDFPSIKIGSDSLYRKKNSLNGSTHRRKGMGEKIEI